MKLELYPRIVYRVPKFHQNITLKEAWDALKESIKTASPEFFSLIENVHYDQYCELPEKIQLTILKYFNRAKLRPVPFGTFAGVGLIDPSETAEKGVVQFDSRQRIHRFHDWTFRNEMEYPFSEVLKKDCKLMANSSYYTFGRSIRYLFKNQEGFELAEIEMNQLILAILKSSRYPISLSDLVEITQNVFPNEDEILRTLEDMIGEQLLITSLDANIIGTDYFQRLKTPFDDNIPEYIIAEMEYHSGALDNKLLKHLPALVTLLHELLPEPEKPASLRQFIQEFRNRYDQMEIPIMEALDPVIGIGYANMELPAGVSNIIAELASHKDAPVASSDYLKEFLQPLMSMQSGKSIDLETLLNEEKIGRLDCKLTNSVTVMFTVADNMVCIDHIGGVSSNQLLGRFSLPGTEIYKHCKRIAQLEEEANPDVLLFDVGYMGESKVDNVNRRLQLYEHQLSILNFDITSNPVTLDDILISLQGDSVWLRSKATGKILIPRLASAYNYTRSDLSLYRLLSDISFQAVRPNLNIDLQQLFPGAMYYPRLTYRNIILSAAKWRLSKKSIGELSACNLTTQLRSLALSDYIKFGQGDQTLIIRIDDEQYLPLLIAALRKQDFVWVEEVLISKLPIMKDQNGKSYRPQFITSLLHRETIYKASPSKQAANVCRVFPPGSEWLYFEIYTHTEAANDLLIHILAPFLENHKRKIQKWFFIRYDEGGDHIRLRLRLCDYQDAGYLVSKLQQLLRPQIESSIIADLQIKTYKRELERYSSVSIDELEDFFFQDSHFIISLLKLELSEDEYYRIILYIVWQVCHCGLWEAVDLSAWVNAVRKHFSKEHQMQTTTYKKLNKWVQQQVQLWSAKPILPQEQMQPQVVLWMDILAKSAAYSRKQLLGDILHLHINRLFPNHQRSHEYVIYELLSAQLKAVDGKINKRMPAVLKDN